MWVVPPDDTAHTWWTILRFLRFVVRVRNGQRSVVHALSRRMHAVRMAPGERFQQPYAAIASPLPRHRGLEPAEETRQSKRAAARRPARRSSLAVARLLKSDRYCSPPIGLPTNAAKSLPRPCKTPGPHAHLLTQPTAAAHVRSSTSLPVPTYIPGADHRICIIARKTSKTRFCLSIAARSDRKPPNRRRRSAQIVGRGALLWLGIGPEGNEAR